MDVLPKHQRTWARPLSEHFEPLSGQTILQMSKLLLTADHVMHAGDILLKPCPIHVSIQEIQQRLLQVNLIPVRMLNQPSFLTKP